MGFGRDLGLNASMREMGASFRVFTDGELIVAIGRIYTCFE